MIEFLLDHDVPETLARAMDRGGYRIRRLRDVLPLTATDQEVMTYARVESLIIVTCNRDDFVALASRGENPGVVVAIRRRTGIAECAALLRLIRAAGESGIRHNITFA